MKLFTFRSAATADLHCYTLEAGGTRLPAKFAPWDAIGVVRSDQPVPKGLDRAKIESGIAANGYQLWRKKKA